MFNILQKRKLADNTYLIEIEAPYIAKKAKPGQFIILRIGEKGERIPLTIADFSRKTITVVFQVVGKTTDQLSSLKKGDIILDVAGPLGNPSKIQEYGKVCVIGGGLGIAPIYPIARDLKKANNRLTVIIGGKGRGQIFWEDHFRPICDSFLVSTDDGSRGKKGLVSDVLKELMQKEKLDMVFAIGPPLMMKSVSDMTRGKVTTTVSLNPIMIDGIGMCGGCRVVIGDKVMFACCDGPEFNGHKVDWEELLNRNDAYSEEERCACRIKDV